MAQPRIREKQLERCIDLANRSIRSAADGDGEYKTTIVLSVYSEFKNVSKYRMNYLAKKLVELLNEAEYKTNYYKLDGSYYIEVIFGDGEYIDEEI
jgi:hypothetical protein